MLNEFELRTVKDLNESVNALQFTLKEIDILFRNSQVNRRLWLYLTLANVVLRSNINIKVV